MIVCTDHTTPYGAIDAYENYKLEDDFNLQRCIRCEKVIVCTDQLAADGYCSIDCWVSSNHPNIKAWLTEPISNPHNELEYILKLPTALIIFDCCTESTANRWKRAIELRVNERDALRNFEERQKNDK